MWISLFIILFTSSAFAIPAQLKRNFIDWSPINQPSFFCQCIQNGGLFPQAQCGAPLKNKSETAEIMHLVPLDYVAKELKEYQQGHRKCSRGGKIFKGLECALVVNQKLKELSLDAHNMMLVEPSIKEVIENNVLGIPRESKKIGLCPFTYDENFISLSSSNKSWFARIYLYLDSEYPEFNIKSRLNYPRLEDEAKLPTSKHECLLNKKINSYQSSQNLITKKKCEERKQK